MYDQNDQQNQSQSQDNQTPFGQPPAPTNDGALGVNHQQNPFGTPPAPATPAQPPAPVSSVSGDASDLLTIKQEALQQLSPLVGQLDQGPEEKFKTTMMMIQASDDQSLVKAAYETAKQIPDEKARAQALLDVVNEINYFTQQNQKSQS